MTADEQVGNELPTRASATPRLEDLIPIAVVIAAGCERCAERMVGAALAHGVPGPDIERTLGIVAHLHSRDCFAQAVGPEVVARMARPLAAGRKCLRTLDPVPEGSACCR
jgi:hypothetical protein